MGYSTTAEVVIALANALTSGNPSPDSTGAIPITSIGKSVTDTVSTTEMNQYIRWADENIDAAISGLVVTPLQRVNMGSYELTSDVLVGDTIINVTDATRFIAGDVVLIRNASGYEELVISAINSSIQFEISLPITTIAGFAMADSKIERIKYPDPIPKISARMAAAYIYDKHFAAQQEGNKSDFGKHLRTLAYQDLNRILDRTILLAIPDANRYVGRRYFNQALEDTTWNRPASKEDPYKEA